MVDHMRKLMSKINIIHTNHLRKILGGERRWLHPDALWKTHHVGANTALYQETLEEKYAVGIEVWKMHFSSEKHDVGEKTN